MTTKRDISDAKLRESFDKFDKDKSGSVSTAEIKAILTDLGMDAEEVRAMAEVSDMKFQPINSLSPGR